MSRIPSHVLDFLVDYLVDLPEQTRGAPGYRPWTGGQDDPAEAADVPGNGTTGDSVAVGGTYNGTLEVAGDYDWIRVQLVAGETYTIDLNGSGAAPVSDTYLRVYSPGSTDRTTGTLVASDDDAGPGLNSTVTFTATQTGTYFIDAGSYNNASAGDYTVDVYTDTLPDNSEIWSTQQIADFLTMGYWGGTQRHWDVSTDRIITVNFTDISAAYVQFAINALNTWSDATGLIFQQVSSGANITFIDDNSGAYSSSSRSGGFITSSTINIQQNWASDAYTQQTFIHEIGHSLGLGHGGSYNGSATFGVDNLYGNDSWQATVMSYFDQTENTIVDASFAYVTTPMLADIVAIRDLYGTTGTTRTGDTVYGYGTNAGSAFNENIIDDKGTNYTLTIIDDGGTDTLNLSGSVDNNRIDLAPGSISDTGGLIGNISIAFGTLIENAIGGAGADTFFGNDANNVFTGNGGNDTFHDSNGSDQYFGGSGTDTVLFDLTFASYSFSTSGSFLLITEAWSDWIDPSVETIVFFGGEAWSFSDLFSLPTGNGAPDAVNDAYTVAEDVVLSGQNVLANDTDPEGDPRTVTAVNGSATSVGSQITLASGALLTLNANGTFSYDQNGAFDGLNVGQTGTDSFTYTASASGGSDTATVTITIQGAFDNTPPNAVNDGYNGAEGAVISGDVTDNDTDSDGGTVTVISINGSAAAVGNQITLASGALLILNADGTFSYDQNGIFETLEDGQTGNDSFTYGIADGQGGTDFATVSITVDGVSPPSADVPVLIDFEAPAPIGTYAGTSDLAFSGLSVQAGSSLGGVQLGATGSNGDFTITALGGDFDFDSALLTSVSGRVRVTIEAWDDGALVGSQTMNLRAGRSTERLFDTTFDSVDEIRVISNGAIQVDNLSFVIHSGVEPGGNALPVAMDDDFATDELTSFSGTVLNNDFDLDGGALTVSGFSGGALGAPVILASGATVTMRSDGTFDYDPGDAFLGLYSGQSAVDGFTYDIVDLDGASATASVSITVNGVGDPPPATVVDFEGGVPSGAFAFADTAITTRAKGVVSGSEAGISSGDSITITAAQNFDFESGWFTAVRGRRETLTVEAWDDGIQTGSQSFTITDRRETFLELDDAIFDSVDQVVITASGGVIVDDLTLIG